MRVGIGIPTYNRLESLEKTISSVRSVILGLSSCDLCIVDDGSSDDTVDWLVSNHIIHISHRKNRGVCAAKNTILQRFRNHDFIFIIEDDVTILKYDLFRIYLRAIEVFGIQHWNFLAPWQREPVKPNETRDGLTMMFSKLLGGALSVYTREVIEKVGAFNPEFHGYGYGHCEYTLRASRAGLTTPWNQFAHLVDAEDFVTLTTGNAVKPKEQREEERKANLRVLRKSLQDKNLIYIPLEASIVHV